MKLHSLLEMEDPGSALEEAAAHQVFTRYSASRDHRSCSAWHLGTGQGRRTQHKLFAKADRIGRFRSPESSGIRSGECGSFWAMFLSAFCAFALRVERFSLRAFGSAGAI